MSQIAEEAKPVQRLSPAARAYLIKLISAALRVKHCSHDYLLGCTASEDVTEELAGALLTMVVRSHNTLEQLRKKLPKGGAAYSPTLQERHLFALQVSQNVCYIRVPKSLPDKVDYELNYGLWFALDRKGLPTGYLYRLGESAHGDKYEGRVLGVYDRRKNEHLCSMANLALNHGSEGSRYADWED